MKGKCLCGAVAFEVIGEIPNLYQCHCSMCRKSTGSSANAATFVRADMFRWVSGKDKISSFTKDTGYRSDFCSICGSPVPNPLRDTDKVWVPAGLLEETQGLAVVIHLHMKSQACWERTSQDAQEYDEAPNLETLDNALQRTRC